MSQQPEIVKEQLPPEAIQVSPNMGSMIAAAEINQQIATAKNWPRSVERSLLRLRTLATVSEQVAASCSYALPRAGKEITGPSVRFAEILLSTWSNSRCASRVVDEGRENITAQGVFMDLESNSSVVCEVTRRIVDKKGQRYNADMIATASNAATSIARRNAILTGIPRAIWDPIWRDVRAVAAGDEATFADRRTKAIAYAQTKYGVGRDRLLARLEARGEADITMDSFVTLKALFAAIDEGEMTAEQAFPPVDLAPSGAGKKSRSERLGEEVGVTPKKEEPNAAQ